MMTKYISAHILFSSGSEDFCVMIFNSYANLLNYLCENRCIIKDYEEVSIIRRRDRKGV